MRNAECGLWNINNETRHLVSYPDLVGTIALRCPRWRSPLIGQRNGELSGGGRESAGQRTAQRAGPYPVWWPMAKTGQCKVQSRSIPLTGGASLLILTTDGHG